jgi:KDO2-lipid IV(A) lauroyltransferase
LKVGFACQWSGVVPKSRSQFLDYLVYLLVRIFVCIVQTMSLECACTLAQGLARLCHRLDRRHREVALQNLENAFPGVYSEAERGAIVRKVYAHFCRLLVELIQIPRRLHLHNWMTYLDVGEGRQLVECLLSDRPLMIVSGHYGNWEIGGYALGLLGFKTHGVARPLDNPYLDKFLRQFRERTGQKLLAKKGDYAQIQSLLGKAGIIGFLVDQDAGQRGLFVNFFGIPASTHKAIALLALEYRVPILVMLATSSGLPMHYQSSIEELILPETYIGRPEGVRELTQRFTAALERGVRRNPEQYFWLHRRWKHQPAALKRQRAA